MAQYQLVLRVGPTPGKVFPLMKNELTIGRDINNEIVINDAEISRRHCRLVLFGDGYTIEDLGSTNGTWVREQRLTGQHQLRPGETLRLGDNITLIYEMVGVDTDATVAGDGIPAQPATMQPRRAQQAPPPPYQQPPPVRQAPPIQQTPPPQYAGQVPVSPMPPQPKKKSSRGLMIGCAALVLIGLCLAVFLWYVDANCLWCEITWDMLPGCPYTGTCP